MDADDEGKAIRFQVAQRYGKWVRECADRRGWTAAELARRSGLKKQTVSQILHGESPQPTAWQVGQLAKALRVEPNEIYQATGLWEPSEEEDTALQSLIDLYRQLSGPGREAAMGHLRLVRELQDEYTTERGDLRLSGTLQAVLHRPGESPRTEELHFTEADVPDWMPVVANTGEDLERARRLRRDREESEERDGDE